MNSGAGNSRLKLVLLVLLYVLAIGFATVETQGPQTTVQTEGGR